MGVIVYSNFIKVVLATFKNLVIYGRVGRKKPLSPPHRASESRKTQKTMGKVSEQVSESTNKVRLLITYIMLSRNATSC